MATRFNLKAKDCFKMKRSEQFISDFAQLMSRGPERFEQFVENLPPPKRENLISALDQLSRVVADSVAVQREPLGDSKSASALAEEDCANAPKAASAGIATSSKTVVPHRKHGARPKSAGAFSYDDVQTPEIADPRAAEMLGEIKEKLTTARMLKSRSTLSEVAYKLDVPLGKRDTMPRMAQKILTALADRDPMEIEKAFGIINQEAKRGSSEAFMEYAAFIVGDRRND